MAKSVFGIVLDEPTPESKSRIETAYPDNTYTHTDSFILVETDHVARKVRETIGLGSEDENGKIFKGVVFKLSRSYSGYTSMSLWDWMKGTEELKPTD